MRRLRFRVDILGLSAHLKLSRYAFSVCSAAVLLSGCGGPQTQGWNALSPLQPSTKLSGDSLKGGSFTGSYAGKYESGCSFVCFTDYHGKGSGTFIGRSRLKGEVFNSCCPSSCGGGFTFRSKRHPADAFTVSASCGETASYTVTGGKGKFAGASGGGTVSFSVDNSNDTFTSSWTGTLYY